MASCSLYWRSSIASAARARHRSLLRIAALSLALAVAFELKAVVTGASAAVSGAALALSLAALVLLIARDALDQFR
jgi:uncharacterized membrane protein